MKPSDEQIEGQWTRVIVKKVEALVEGLEEIEDDPEVVLVNRSELDALQDLASTGPNLDDVELWIWAHAPAAFKRAKKLLMNPSFLRAAKKKP